MTDHDRYILELATPLLRQGEQVRFTAFSVELPPLPLMWLIGPFALLLIKYKLLAVTDARILLFRTSGSVARVPRPPIRGVEEIEWAAVTRVRLEGRRQRKARLVLRDGTARVLGIWDRGMSFVSGQKPFYEFLRNRQNAADRRRGGSRVGIAIFTMIVAPLWLMGATGLGLRLLLPSHGAQVTAVTTGCGTRHARNRGSYTALEGYRYTVDGTEYRGPAWYAMTIEDPGCAPGRTFPVRILPVIPSVSLPESAMDLDWKHAVGFTPISLVLALLVWSLISPKRESPPSGG